MDCFRLRGFDALHMGVQHAQQFSAGNAEFHNLILLLQLRQSNLGHSWWFRCIKSLIMQRISLTLYRIGSYVVCHI
jgi:hypothetical protein